jgi:hypothetical protein
LNSLVEPSKAAKMDERTFKGYNQIHQKEGLFHFYMPDQYT